MEMVKVKSSNISAIGFESTSDRHAGLANTVTLRIEFSHGASYDYKAVPKIVFSEFVQSESKGKFFHANIKDKFLAKKVGK
jgi:hypothetical protein